MTWAKIDDRFPRHPKSMAAGPEGRDLFVCGLCYCNEHLTDGFIPSAAVQGLAPGNRRYARTAALLVDLRLWDQVEGGYRVHDYHDWNPSAQDVREGRKAKAERTKRWRDRRWKPDGDASRGPSRDASSSASQAGGVRRLPTPTPTPTPTTPPKPPRAPKRHAPPDPAAAAWLDCLNQAVGSDFKPTPRNLQPIRARLSEDFTLEQAQAVVQDRVTRWKGTDMAEYLRPETVFGGKFDSYLQATKNGAHVDPYAAFPRD